jgi:outer membrane immunogenic protein
MKRSTLVLAIVVLLVFGSSGAQAGDQMDLWYGPYIGGNLGYGFSELRGIHDSADANPDNLNTLEPDGLVGGGHVGFNGQWDQFVLGVEGDFMLTDMTDRQASPGAEPGSVSSKINHLASIRARAGIAHEDFLAYLTAGVAFANFELTSRRSTVAPFKGTRKFNSVGGVVGAGLDWRLTGLLENASVRIEGLYYWFDDNNSISNEAVPDADTGDFISLEHAVVVRAGFTIHFDVP